MKTAHIGDLSSNFTTTKILEEHLFFCFCSSTRPSIKISNSRNKASQAIMQALASEDMVSERCCHSVLFYWQHLARNAGIPQSLVIWLVTETNMCSQNLNSHRSSYRLYGRHWWQSVFVQRWMATHAFPHGYSCPPCPSPLEVTKHYSNLYTSIQAFLDSVAENLCVSGLKREAWIP